MADAHLVFPSASNVVLSDMTLTAVMRRMKQSYVPHGFRSTFATWAQERTNHPSDVRERALAHSVGNKTTEAYERGDQFEKRKRLMSDWNQFISMSPDAINIIKFKKSK
jgi:integrase